MKTTVKVEGLKEIEAALGQFTVAKRRAIGRVALQNAGEITAKAARALVPVDSGGLRESIDVSGSLSKGQKGQHGKQADQERFIGPDSRPQGHLREFGGDGNPPQPFMRPAWDETKDQVLQRIGDELIVGIEKAVQQSARRAAKRK
jgi:HK97 gp10 family phage protein